MATDSSNPYGSKIDMSEIATQAGDGTLVFTAEGAATFLASGAAGEVLKVNSAGTALEFGAGSGFVLLADSTLGTAATTMQVNVTTTGYKFILILLSDCSTSDTNFVLMRFNADGGNNYGGVFIRNSGSAISHFACNASSIQVVEDTVANDLKGFCTLLVTNPGSTNTFKNCWVNSGDGVNQCHTGTALWNNTANAISTIDLLVNGGGNITAGARVTVYGLS